MDKLFIWANNGLAGENAREFVLNPAQISAIEFFSASVSGEEVDARVSMANGKEFSINRHAAKKLYAFLKENSEFLITSRL